MGSLPPLALAGAIIACVGELLHIVGLATTKWLSDGPIQLGLFQVCIQGVCSGINDKTLLGILFDLPAFEAIRAMCIIGVLAGLVAVGCAVVYLVFNIMSKSTPSIMGLVTLGSAIVAFVFIIIGVIVFAVEIYDPITDQDVAYGFSFALSITGGVLLLVGGILFFKGSKQTQ